VLAFFEPMVTIEHLKTRTNRALPIPQPAAVQRSGWYPTRYRVSTGTTNESRSRSRSSCGERAPWSRSDSWKGGRHQARRAVSNEGLTQRAGPRCFRGQLADDGGRTGAISGTSSRSRTARWPRPACR
jgi:hypothetical protein